MHIVACYDPGDKNTPGAGVSIYKNGVFVSGPKTTPGALYSNKLFNVMSAHTATSLRLGSQDLHSYLIGGLQDVAIYPRVLKPAEIKENYNAHSGRAGTNPPGNRPVRPAPPHGEVARGRS